MTGISHFNDLNRNVVITKIDLLVRIAPDDTVCLPGATFEITEQIILLL